MAVGVEYEIMGAIVKQAVSKASDRIVPALPIPFFHWASGIMNILNRFLRLLEKVLNGNYTKLFAQVPGTGN